MSTASPTVVPPDIMALCVTSAAKYGLTPELLAALAWKESSFNPYAWNPEPAYPYLVNVRTGAPFRPLTVAERAREVPPFDFPTFAGDRDQEFWAQQSSWGLCQVMGAVARELGFRGPYLTELVRPDVNLDLGAHHLSKQIARFGSVGGGLSAYNAGTPTDKNRASYVEPILRVAEAIRDQVAA